MSLALCLTALLCVVHVQENPPKLQVEDRTLMVREDPSNSASRSIPLHYVVLSTAKSPKEAPLLVIQGGPGQAGTDLLKFYETAFASLLDDRKIVLFDQRGTGTSNGLRFPETDRPLQLSQRFPPDRVLAAITALGPVADLSKYHSLNAVADIEALRKDLGVSTLCLYGTSYGTRVAYLYARKYPARARCLILKGVMPFDRPIGPTFADDSQAVFDAVCKLAHNKYPDLRNSIQRLQKRLSNEPVVVPQPGGDPTKLIRIDEKDLAVFLRYQVMSRSAIERLPKLLTDADKGSTQDLYDQIASTTVAIEKGLYPGMSLSILRNEDYAALLKSSTRKHSKTFLGDAYVEDIRQGCALWPVDTSQILDVLHPAHLHVPALMLSGSLDAATPPKWGKHDMKYFDDCLQAVVKNASHSWDGYDPLVRTMRAFLAAGTTKGLVIPSQEYELNFD